MPADERPPGEEVAAVDTSPADLRFIIIQCSECRAEVDRVEYDAAVSTPQAVTQMMATLGVEEDQARNLVKRHNPDALRTPEEGAQELAAAIVARKVADRDADTYACRNGHEAPLEIR